jgi:hypothetical protein
MGKQRCPAKSGFSAICRKIMTILGNVLCPTGLVPECDKNGVPSRRSPDGYMLLAVAAGGVRRGLED